MQHHYKEGKVGEGAWSCDTVVDHSLIVIEVIAKPRSDKVDYVLTN
jgi:hypothetical protein